MDNFEVHVRVAAVAEWLRSNSYVRVQRWFRRVYNQVPPTKRTLWKWVNKFRGQGVVISERGRGGGRRSMVEERRAVVAEIILENPRTSLRRAAGATGIPHNSVRNILRQTLRFYPYKEQVVQRLYDKDKVARLNFGQLVIDRLEENPDFLRRIGFSDEATFHTSGRANRQNQRMWAAENPHFVRELDRDSPKLNVWVCIFHDRVIGPYFFPNDTIKGTLDSSVGALHPTNHEVVHV